MKDTKEQKQATEAREEAGSGRLDRLADQSRGLVEDIKEWIDLKLQLVQLELEERFETVANRVLATIIVLVLAFVTLIFALAAAALGIGNWLGDPVWGFLIVTGVLALITLTVHLANPRIVKAPWKTKSKALPEAQSVSKTARLPKEAQSIKERSENGAGDEKDKGAG